MATLADFNRYLTKWNIECVKEYDYFYFMHSQNSDLTTVLPLSVYVRAFRDLHLEAWIFHVESAQIKLPPVT